MSVRWYMPNVEQTLVTQIDGFLVKHAPGNHLKRDKVPCPPQSPPFVESGNIP